MHEVPGATPNSAERCIPSPEFAVFQILLYLRAGMLRGLGRSALLLSAELAHDQVLLL